MFFCSNVQHSSSSLSVFLLSSFCADRPSPLQLHHSAAERKRGKKGETPRRKMLCALLKVILSHRVCFHLCLDQRTKIYSKSFITTVKMDDFHIVDSYLSENWECAMISPRVPPLLYLFIYFHHCSSHVAGMQGGMWAMRVDVLP